MKISPSIASSDLLHLADEVEFVNRYFDLLHLDVEDGHAVNNITFGMKLCKAICDVASAKEISLHLEVSNPITYLEKIKQCKLDVVFIQVDCLRYPLEIIREFQKQNLPVGINLSHLDRNRKDLPELLGASNCFLINTTHHDDAAQVADEAMLVFAQELADTGKKVWIDGGITEAIYQKLKDSKIHAAVMGRAIFADKEKAVRQFIECIR